MSDIKKPSAPENQPPKPETVQAETPPVESASVTPETTPTATETPKSVPAPAAGIPKPVIATTPVTPPSVLSSAQQPKLLQWWIDIFQKFSSPVIPTASSAGGRPNPFASSAPVAAKEDAKNRLKLVLLHDRTQISPTLLESMREELVGVISKYVEIDSTALDLCLQQDADTIALVANISVVRARREAGGAEPAV